jgi:hypothetical protein
MIHPMMTRDLRQLEGVLENLRYLTHGITKRDICCDNVRNYAAGHDMYKSHDACACRGADRQRQLVIDGVCAYVNCLD